MRPIIKIAIVCLPLLLTGCFASQPSTFYLLKAVDTNQYGKNDLPATNLNIYIRPVIFPDYLDRPQMVIRENDYKLQLSEYHRWAEPLQDNFTKVLIENINARITPGRVISYAELKHTEVDFQLLIEVLRLDVNTKELAILNVNWTLMTGQGDQPLLQQNNVYNIPLADSSYEFGVAAQSKAIAEFSDQIAAVIQGYFLSQDSRIP